MKTKTLNLMLTSILALVALTAFGSAAITLNPNTYSTSISHGSSTSFSFNIFNDGGSGTDYTLVNITAIPSNLVYGANSINSGNVTLSNIPSSVANDTTSSAITVSINVPSYQPAGNYTGEVTVGGKHNETGSSVASRVLSLSINVTESKSLSFSSPTADFNKDRNSTTITLTNTGNVALTNINLTSSGDFGITFSGTGVSENVLTSLGAGDSETLTVSMTENFDSIFGASTTITAKASDNTTTTKTLTYSGDYCEGISGLSVLTVDIEEFNVVSGFGEDDDFVYPFDEIEFEINVDVAKYDTKKIELEWELYTAISKYKIASGSESRFSLDSGDDKDITLKIKLDKKVSKLEGENQLILLVKAKGEISDSDAGTDNKKTICASDSLTIDLITDEEFVIIDNFEMPESVPCDSEVTISADVWNIWDEDLEEVYVRVYNSELGIDKNIEIGDIDSFDSERLNFVLTVPENALEKTYTLRFTVYNEDDDVFENDNEDEAIFTQFLAVSGSCSTNTQTNAVISASLESGGKAGKSLVVKSTITNTGTTTATYTITATDYSEWAEDYTVDKSTIVLNAGESAEIQFTLNVKKGVSGEKTFNIGVSSGSDSALEQPVAVTIEKANFLSGITGNVIGGDGSNWYLWVIGAVNVILVLIIIVVAFRIAKS